MNSCRGSWLVKFQDTTFALFSSKVGLGWETANCCAAPLPMGSKSS